MIQKLHLLIKEENVSSRQVANILEIDQGLTARVLRLVNSPFYGFSRQIASVDEAITMLGFNAVHKLILTSTLLSSFKISGSTINLQDFWMHSFGVGVFAKYLLSSRGSEPQEEAFIGGVLHDVGRLILVRADPRKYADFYCSDSIVTDLEQEREFFGEDHQRLGEMLARKWNFPEPVTAAIANHHNPEHSGEHMLLVAAVNIANMLTHTMGIGDSGNFYVSEFSPESWQILGLSMAELDQHLRRGLDEIEKSAEILRAES